MTASTHRRLQDTGSQSNASGGGFQRRPLALVCMGCGGQYFAASLPIHQKTCFARNPFVEIACPTCHGHIKSGTFHDHVACCKGTPVQVAETPAIRRVTSKQEARAEELNPPDADGRVRCRNCERGFHADRIAKHQSVCVGTRRRNLESHAMMHPPTGERQRIRPPIQTASPKRRQSYVARLRGVLAVSLEFSTSTNRPVSRDRPSREDKRFDLVHRDGARRFDANSRLNLSMSTATSSNNPLATTRLMTLTHSWG